MGRTIVEASSLKRFPARVIGGGWAFRTGRRQFARGGPGGGDGFAALQMMKQRRGNIDGSETFLEKTFDQPVLLLVFAGGEGGAEFIEEDICARLLDFTGGG